MEVSNYLVSWLISPHLFMGRIQPTFIWVIIHLLSTMDTLVSFENEDFYPATFLGKTLVPYYIKVQSLTKPHQTKPKLGLACPMLGKRESKIFYQMVGFDDDFHPMGSQSVKNH